MSSKPKGSDYKASEEEKALASVSLADKKFFRENYLPKLTELRDQSAQQDYQGVARGRAQADTMQALTSRPSIQAARSVDSAANLASAAGSQQAQADFQALQAKRQRQVGVLGTARGQAADATTGLSRAAQIQSTKDLEFAKARQQERDARFAAGLKIATTGAKQAMQNMQSGDGGSFFTPAGLSQGDLGKSDMNMFQKRLGAGAYGNYDPVTGNKYGS